MRRSHTETPSPAIGSHLTPLIDVVFILLIFFVVTSSFVKEAGIEVDRPSAQTAARLEEGNIVIAISADGEIWAEDRRLDRRMVRSYVERLYLQNPESSVVILADRRSPMGVTVEVMDQARLAGVSNVAIAAARQTDQGRAQ